jgi:hypothetical protein
VRVVDGQLHLANGVVQAHGAVAARRQDLAVVGAKGHAQQVALRAKKLAGALVRLDVKEAAAAEGGRDGGGCGEKEGTRNSGGGARRTSG